MFRCVVYFLITFQKKVHVGGAFDAVKLVAGTNRSGNLVSASACFSCLSFPHIHVKIIYLNYQKPF
jgi:hypothetical protein